MKYSTGFTLVELLITVAIISILAVVATPSLIQTLANQRMKSAAYELTATFSEARYQAALQRVTMTVTSNGSATQWKAASSAKTADVHWQLTSSADVAEPLLQSSVDRRVEMMTDLGSTTVEFLQTGTINAAQDVFFRVCDSAVAGEEGYTVMLGRFGSSRVYSGSFGTGAGAQSCT